MGKIANKVRSADIWNNSLMPSIEMERRKPPAAGMGRKLGSRNKHTIAFKDMIRGALDAEGGVKWLRQQMYDNPADFLRLLGKLLPTQVTGLDGGPIRHELSLAERRERALRHLSEVFAEPAKVIEHESVSLTDERVVRLTKER